MISENLLQSLVGGGEITLHTHPHMVTLDQLHRMQQLEKTVYTVEDYTMKQDDDFIFVNTINGPVTITLLSARIGQHITISRIGGADSITVLPPAGETINLVANAIITTSFEPLRLKGVRDLGYLEI